MQWVAALLSELGIGASGAGQHEAKAFPDGAAFRIEIPSVEGPRVLEAVLDAAEAEGITVNRVSQGSGAGLLRASELRAMAQAGHDAGVEVCLFIGPRERYGIGAHPRSSDGSAQGDQVRGTRQLGYALEDVLRAAEQGIRSFLVADLGLLVALRKAQERGDLPEGIVWNASGSAIGFALSLQRPSFGRGQAFVRMLPASEVRVRLERHGLAWRATNRQDVDPESAMRLALSATIPLICTRAE